MTGYIFVALAVLVAVAGWRVRRRRRHASRSGVTDEIVRRIETVGRVDAEDVEPVDLELARTEGGRILGPDVGRARRKLVRGLAGIR